MHTTDISATVAPHVRASKLSNAWTAARSACATFSPGWDLITIKLEADQNDTEAEIAATCNFNININPSGLDMSSLVR